MDIPGDISTPAVLPLTSAYTQSVFERSGDSDWFRVTLKKNVNYAVQLDCNLGDCSVSVRDRQGGELAQSFGSSDIDTQPGLSLIAPYDGTFFVEARGYQPRPYRLRMAKDCAEDFRSICALTADGKGSGDLFSFNDRDWLAVELERGKTYDAQVRGSNFDGGLSVGVVTRFGGALELDSATSGPGFASFAGFKPRKTDRYFIVVSGEYGTGPYQVTVTERR